MVRTQVLKHLPGTGKGERGGAKEMPGEERLPEKEFRKAGVSGSLRGRRSEEITQSNAFYPLGSEVPLESQRG